MRLAVCLGATWPLKCTVVLPLLCAVASAAGELALESAVDSMVKRYRGAPLRAEHGLVLDLHSLHKACSAVLQALQPGDVAGGRDQIHASCCGWCHSCRRAAPHVCCGVIVGLPCCLTLPPHLAQWRCPLLSLATFCDAGNAALLKLACSCTAALAAGAGEKPGGKGLCAELCT